MESACRQMESDRSLHRKTRQKVKRAAPGGEGYVMNHLSKGGKNYLSRFDRAFKVARQVIHILSSTIHTKFIKLTGRMISWNSSLVDGGINWKNISPNSWIKPSGS